MSLKICIVEDEKNSREGLKNLIEEFCNGAEIVGLASTVEEGLDCIREKKPDLLMLDIEMQTATGFDLLERLDQIDFDIIFTTAYEQYAIKAIKFSALDYLLKPIDVNELVAAVDKVKEKRKKLQEEQVQTLLKNLKVENPKTHKITLSTSEGMAFIPVSEIIRCEAQGAYTNFILKERKPLLVSKNLKEYESLLTDYGFLRIHNSHLINLSEVDKYIKADGGYVLMKDGSQVGISNTRKEEFLEKMRSA